MDKDITELFVSQSQVIATLALRVSVLEKLLLDKKIITDTEVINETQVMAKEFTAKTKEMFQKITIKK